MGEDIVLTDRTVLHIKINFLTVYLFQKCNLEKLMKKAEKKGRILEILFHPGTAFEDELGEEFCNKEANKFYTSAGRHIEYECVLSLHNSL